MSVEEASVDSAEFSLDESHRNVTDPEPLSDHSSRRASEDNSEPIIDEPVVSNTVDYTEGDNELDESDLPASPSQGPIADNLKDENELAEDRSITDKDSSAIYATDEDELVEHESIHEEGTQLAIENESESIKSEDDEDDENELAKGRSITENDPSATLIKDEDEDELVEHESINEEGTQLAIEHESESIKSDDEDIILEDPKESIDTADLADHQIDPYIDHSRASESQSIHDGKLHTELEDNQEDINNRESRFKGDDIQESSLVPGKNDEQDGVEKISEHHLDSKPSNSNEVHAFTKTDELIGDNSVDNSEHSAPPIVVSTKKEIKEPQASPSSGTPSPRFWHSKSDFLTSEPGSRRDSTASADSSRSEKKALGKIDYDSYFEGPQDKLVSRLVSSFESQMQSASTPTDKYSKPVKISKPSLVTVKSEKKSFSLDRPTRRPSEHSIASGTDQESASTLPFPEKSYLPEKSNEVEISNEVTEPKPVEQVKQVVEPSVTFEPINIEQPQVEDGEENMIFGVCVVGFNHARGPEVEYWVGPDGDKSTVWPYLAFQSLPDGSHSHEENFCYFTMLYDTEQKIAVNPTPKRDEEGHIVEQSDFRHATTLFGISCNRQLKVEELNNKTSDITRSTVQKSVVVVARKPIFGPIKEKLAIVTRAYFIQGDFEDRRIIDHLYENLTQIFNQKIDESEMNVGMPLRELVHRLGYKVLTLLKALLLEKRIFFYASNTELLCASQFSLISLIPNLINELDDCGSPLLSTYELKLKKPSSLRTSDRDSLLAFMGLPLQLFAAGGIFSPYVPLQQLDELKAQETKYFLVGSTNSLVLNPSVNYDIIVNMDEDSVKIVTKSLESPLALSWYDKRFMDAVIHAVDETWDAEDPYKTKGLVFYGSEDWIRIQFEGYLMHMLSCVKYNQFLTKLGSSPPPMMIREINGNPLTMYNMNWANAWKQSNSYRIFNKFTDEELFDIVEPTHMALSFSKPSGDNAISKVNKVFSNLWARKSSQNLAGPSKTPSPDGDDAQSVTSHVSSNRGEKYTEDALDSQGPSTPVGASPSVLSPAHSRSTTSEEPAAPKDGYFSTFSKWASSRKLFAKKSPSPVEPPTPEAEPQKLDSDSTAN